MVKWVTLLGRVFKIHDFFCMIFDRFIKIFTRQPHPVRWDVQNP